MMGTRHMQANRTSCSRSGFTLIELLVVVSIITLLIAVLLPALSKARQAAQAARCLANVRQVNTAIFVFAADNRNYLPFVSWRLDLITGGYLPGKAVAGDPTASLIFRCPNDNDARPSNDRFAMRASYCGSFGYNPTTDPDWVPQTPKDQIGMFPNHAGADRIRVDEARIPSKTLTTVEFWTYNGYVGYRSGMWQDSNNRVRGRSTYGPTTPLHDQRGNMAFVDGHARLMLPSGTFTPATTNQNGLVGTGDTNYWNRR